MAQVTTEDKQADVNAQPDETTAFPETLPVALPLQDPALMLEAHVPHEAIHSWNAVGGVDRALDPFLTALTVGRSHH